MKYLSITYHPQGLIVFKTLEGIEYLDGTQGKNPAIEEARKALPAAPPPPEAAPKVKLNVKQVMEGVHLVKHCPKCRPHWNPPTVEEGKHAVCSNCGSLEASWKGRETTYRACRGCKGTGKPNHGLTNVCIKCGGSGIEPLECPQCGGLGEVFSGSICSKCGGLGIIHVPVPSPLGLGDGCSEC